MDFSNNMTFKKRQPGPADTKRRRSRRRLEVVAEVQQSDAHILFMKEFLAPLLAKEFLRQRNAAISAPVSELSFNESTSAPSFGGVTVRGH